MARPKVAKYVGNIDNQLPISQALTILKPEEMQFAKLVADGISLTEAFKEAYPNLQASKWVNRYAHRLAKDPKIREQVEMLQNAMRVQFVIIAPRALDRMEELAENAKSEEVKLRANQEIMRQAGLSPPQRVESLHIGLFGQLSAEDVRAMVKRNLDNFESVREENK